MSEEVCYSYVWGFLTCFESRKMDGLCYQSNRQYPKAVIVFSHSSSLLIVFFISSQTIRSVFHLQWYQIGFNVGVYVNHNYSNLQIIMNQINIVLLASLFVTLTKCEQQQLQYFIFTPQCYVELVEKLNFSNLDCMQFTFSKLLGYGMVAGGAIVKIPQIIKIIMDKSVYGISYSSIVLELSTNWITIVYSWHRGNPFSIYGQNVFIGIQNLLIMMFFIIYVGNAPNAPNSNEKASSAKYITYLLITCLTLFLTQNPLHWPSVFIQSSMLFQILFFSSARIAQIYHIYKCKSTGSLALITCLLVVLGNLGRLFTVLVETADDYLFIISVVVAFALNFTIVVQFFIYWNNGKQKTQ